MKNKKRGFLDLVLSRKTTYEFSDKKVTRANIKKILEAARWAPSCDNKQPWKFIIVRDKKTIGKLMQLASYGVFHTDPSLIIAIVLIKNCWEGTHRCVKNDRIGIYEAHMCIAMSALSAVFEATDLGISSAILTPAQKEAFMALKLRGEDSIPVMIGLGYEKKGAYQKKRIRKSLKDITSYGYYGNKKEK